MPTIFKREPSTSFDHPNATKQARHDDQLVKQELPDNHDEDEEIEILDIPRETKWQPWDGVKKEPELITIDDVDEIIFVNNNQPATQVSSHSNMENRNSSLSGTNPPFTSSGQSNVLPPKFQQQQQPEQVLQLMAQQQQLWLAQLHQHRKMLMHQPMGNNKQRYGMNNAEEVIDSGNETSSYSPGYTPMTVSSPAHSLPSRSNSFSVSSILRTDAAQAIAQAKAPIISTRTSKTNSTFEKIETPKADPEEVSKGEMTPNATPNNNLVQCGEATPVFAPISQRVAFAPVQQQHAQFIMQTPQHFPLPLMNYNLFLQPMQHSRPTNQQMAMVPPTQIPSIPPQQSIAPSFFHQQLQLQSYLQQLWMTNPNAVIGLFQQQQQHMMQLAGAEFCVVCGDRSSGHHYGVQSCEGCKGFFRRSIQANSNYECLKDGQCEINRTNRSRCQSCRLQKCLLLGMQPSHVRLDKKERKRKSELEQREQCSNATRQTMKLVRELTQGFKNTFITPDDSRVQIGSSASAHETPFQLVKISEPSEGQELCKQFLESITAFKELPAKIRNALLPLSANRLSFTMVLLAVLAGHDQNCIQIPGLSAYLFHRLRTSLDGVEIHLEEAALLAAIALTFDNKSVDALHVKFHTALHTQIVNRYADNENVDPVWLYVNLVHRFSSELFQSITE